MIKSKYSHKRDYQVIKYLIKYQKIKKIKLYKQKKRLKIIKNLTNMIQKMINKGKRLLNLTFIENFSLF